MLKRRKRREKARTIRAGPPASINREERVQYHLEEYKALKAELLEETKAVTANFRNAILLAGGVAAWYLGKHSSSALSIGLPDNLIVWIPFVIAVVLAGQTWGVRKRQIMKCRYLVELERKFRFGCLGWEEIWNAHTKDFPSLHQFGYAEGLSWLVLFIGSGAFGLVGSSAGLLLWKLLINTYHATQP